MPADLPAQPDEDISLESEPAGQSVGGSTHLAAVLLSRPAAQTIWQHALSDTSREVGGVLVGRLLCAAGCDVVAVEHALPARHAEAGSTFVKFTHEAWEEWHALLDTQFAGRCIVGWYHSHPGFGVFLSDHDLFIHENFFRQPWQVAVVSDPVRGEMGYFGWRAGRVVPLPEEAIYQAVEPARVALQPGPPQAAAAPRPTSPAARSMTERWWWLGWGVAVAMFLVLVLQAYGQAKLVRLGRELRAELAQAQQVLGRMEGKLQPPPAPALGRWYTFEAGVSLEKLCEREYGNPEVSRAIMAINGLRQPPEVGTRLWLPAKEALVPAATERTGAGTSEHGGP
jgi:proteasome lid subunit RPN8/RPN11